MNISELLIEKTEEKTRRPRPTVAAVALDRKESTDALLKDFKKTHTPSEGLSDVEMMIKMIVRGLVVEKEGTESGNKRRW